MYVTVSVSFWLLVLDWKAINSLVRNILTDSAEYAFVGFDIVWCSYCPLFLLLVSISLYVKACGQSLKLLKMRSRIEGSDYYFP